MNLRRGKLPFSLYSFRAGFTLSFGFVTIWSLKRSTTKAMASTPPRRSYRVCSVIVYSSLSFLGRIRSAHGPILLIRAVRTTGSSARESLSSTMQLFGYGCITVGPDPSLLPLIHPSDTKMSGRRVTCKAPLAHLEEGSGRSKTSPTAILQCTHSLEEVVFSEVRLTRFLRTSCSR